MPIDKSDYEESCCCFNAAMYSGVPDSAPCPDTIDIKGVIASFDALLNADKEAEAGRLLDLWCAEAAKVGDWRSELTLQSELMGYHRRTNDRESAINAVNRGLALIREHRLGSTVSGATIMLNAATTMKAYGEADKSIPIFAHVSRVFSAHLDPTDYRFAGLYNNMALSYSDCGIFDTAEQYFLKAMAVIRHCERPENELAVTCCNLAELYGKMELEDKVEQMLDDAFAYLSSPDLPHNSYYAFNVSKCLPTFEYFGFFLYARELKARLNEYYERS